MIQVYVDEAAAFDMLAIMALKKDKANGNANYEDFKDDLIDVLGIVQLDDILDSEEYSSLIMANKAVFELIDRVVDDVGYTIPALTVHNANMSRFYAKKALQEKFFGPNTLTEQKTVR